MSTTKNFGSVLSQDKIFLHGDRVREYLVFGKTKAPVTVEIDLTNKCNNACPACAGFNDEKVSLDGNLAYRLITEMGLAGVRGLIFTGGGEPLLHPDLSSLVEHAVECGMSAGLITSGQRPKSLKSESLERIVKLASWVRVSLDGGSPSRYEKTHGLGEKHFYKAQQFVKDLVRHKKNTNSNCTIGVGYLTGVWDCKAEQLDVDMFGILAGQLGVDYAQLRPFHNSKRVVDFSSDVKDYVRKNHPGTSLVRSEHKYASMKGSGSVRNYDYCHGTRFASVIGADGWLYACCHARGQDWGRVINLNPLVSFGYAWNCGIVDAVTKKINVHNCVPLCRCDNFNRSLESLVGKYGNPHKNFL